MDIKQFLKQEIESYFSTLDKSDYGTVKDCSGIVYNFIVKYNPTPSQIQQFVNLLYGNLTYDKINSLNKLQNDYES